MLKRCLALLGLVAVASAQLPTFPNIGYLGKGYDVLLGNPHFTNPVFSPDPGFRSPIYNLTLYSLGSPTPDGRYQVPMGVSAELCNACENSFHSTTSTGTSSYSSSLEQDVTFSFKGWGFEFKGSVDYQQVEQTTKQSDFLIIETESSCCVYAASLAFFAPPPVTADFKNAVKSMPTTFDPTNDYDLVWFYQFIKEFGTHVPGRVTMGGRFGVRTKIESQKYSIMKSSNLNIDLAASYHAMVSVSATSVTGVNKTQSDAFASYTNDTVRFQVGGDFPASGEFSDWATVVSANPMPIHSDLNQLDTLLTAINFPGMDQTVLGQKQVALGAALHNYCVYMVQQGYIANCDPPLPDAPPPPPSVFGGMYQYDSCGKNLNNNPYTSDLTCQTIPDGSDLFTHVPVAEVLAPESMCTSMIYMCLRNSSGSVDPLGFFGGMFQKHDADAGGWPNPFTGGMTCPPGYQMDAVARAELPNKSQGSTIYLCSNKALYQTNPYGGSFQHADYDYKGQPSVPNPLTGATSCPQGYKEFAIARSVTPEPKGSYWGSTIWICLSNVVQL